MKRNLSFTNNKGHIFGTRLEAAADEMIYGYTSDYLCNICYNQKFFLSNYQCFYLVEDNDDILVYSLDKTYKADYFQFKKDYAEFFFDYGSWCEDDPDDMYVVAVYNS